MNRVVQVHTILLTLSIGLKKSFYVNMCEVFLKYIFILLILLLLIIIMLYLFIIIIFII